MTILLTGASGGFGRRAVELLLDRLPAHELILMTRTPEKLADFAARGADIRYGDFDDYESLKSAFTGADKVLLISASKVGSRIPQHTNAINAARAADVRHVVYTSYIGKGPDNPSLAVGDHRSTEDLLRESGMTWTVLRNAQYTDALVEAGARVPLRTGRWLSSTGSGRMPLVTRDDCVDSAVEVLSTPGHEDVIYEITGPELLTYREVAETIAEVAERPIEYLDVDEEAMYAHFDSMGIPRVAVADQSVDAVPWSSEDMVTVERAIRLGFMEVASQDVEKLTGKRPKSLREFTREREGHLKSLRG
ncbi:SDR family oxidoreductase [Streptomyces phaeochromogenes]|uniref:SDR family oxidoreductase n=1 Tax=Streptomyces phaeochromogenes TaxID=1923 RepID=A0ABZ1HN57_STRPH|nr:SDR family oxidoreductase [Streptomyces phaeochromogenes]WSD19685.1 SDR family oxidoreductase [Streptomyces phaeochromogenes]